MASSPSPVSTDTTRAKDKGAKILHGILSKPTKALSVPDASSESPNKKKDVRRKLERNVNSVYAKRSLSEPKQESVTKKFKKTKKDKSVCSQTSKSTSSRSTSTSMRKPSSSDSKKSSSSDRQHSTAKTLKAQSCSAENKQGKTNSSGPGSDPDGDKKKGEEINNNNNDNDKGGGDDDNSGGDRFYYFFDTQSTLVTEEKGTKLYGCEVCKGVYRYAFSLKRHFLRNHINVKYLSEADISNCMINVAQQDIIAKRHASGKRPKSNCVDTGGRRVSMQANFVSKSVSQAELYRCSLCSQLFDYKEDLMEHTHNHMTAPPTVAPTAPVKAQLACDICGMKFTYKQNMIRHQAVHSGNLPFQCEYCQRSFPTLISKKQHVRIHIHNKNKNKANSNSKSKTSKNNNSNNTCTNTITTPTAISVGAAGIDFTTTTTTIANTGTTNSSSATNSTATPNIYTTTINNTIADTTTMLTASSGQSLEMIAAADTTTTVTAFTTTTTTNIIVNDCNNNNIATTTTTSSDIELRAAGSPTATTPTTTASRGLTNTTFTTTTSTVTTTAASSTCLAKVLTSNRPTTTTTTTTTAVTTIAASTITATTITAAHITTTTTDNINHISSSGNNVSNICSNRRNNNNSSNSSSGGGTNNKNLSSSNSNISNNNKSSSNNNSSSNNSSTTKSTATITTTTTLSMSKASTKAEVDSAEDLQCQICEKVFSCSSFLMKHIVCMHNGAMKRKANQSRKKEPISAQPHTHNTRSESSSMEGQAATTAAAAMAAAKDSNNSNSSQTSKQPSKQSSSKKKCKFKYICTVCKRKFRSYVQMCKHRRSAHSKSEDEKGSPFYDIEQTDFENELLPGDFEAPFLEPKDVAENVAQNLRCYIDGRVDSFSDFGKYVKVKGYTSLSDHDPEYVKREPDFVWSEYNFPSSFKKELCESNARIGTERSTTCLKRLGSQDSAKDGNHLVWRLRSHSANASRLADCAASNNSCNSGSVSSGGGCSNLACNPNSPSDSLTLNYVNPSTTHTTTADVTAAASPSSTCFTNVKSDFMCCFGLDLVNNPTNTTTGATTLALSPSSTVVVANTENICDNSLHSSIPPLHHHHHPPPPLSASCCCCKSDSSSCAAVVSSTDGDVIPTPSLLSTSSPPLPPCCSFLSSVSQSHPSLSKDNNNNIAGVTTTGNHPVVASTDGTSIIPTTTTTTTHSTVCVVSGGLGSSQDIHESTNQFGIDSTLPTQVQFQSASLVHSSMSTCLSGLCRAALKQDVMNAAVAATMPESQCRCDSQACHSSAFTGNDQISPLQTISKNDDNTVHSVLLPPPSQSQSCPHNNCSQSYLFPKCSDADKVSSAITATTPPTQLLTPPATDAEANKANNRVLKCGQKDVLFSGPHMMTAHIHERGHLVLEFGNEDEISSKVKSSSTIRNEEPQKAFSLKSSGSIKKSKKNQNLLDFSIQHIVKSRVEDYKRYMAENHMWPAGSPSADSVENSEKNDPSFMNYPKYDIPTRLEKVISKNCRDSEKISAFIKSGLVPHENLKDIENSFRGICFQSWNCEVLNYDKIAFGKQGIVNLICSVCHKHFLNLDSLLRHQLHRHPSIECSFLEVELGQSIVALHYPTPNVKGVLCSPSIDLSASKTLQTYKCSKCSNLFPTVSRLHSHIIRCASNDDNTLATSNSKIGKRKYKKRLKKRLRDVYNGSNTFKFRLKDFAGYDPTMFQESHATRRKVAEMENNNNSTNNSKITYIDDDSEKTRKRRGCDLSYDPRNHVRRRESVEVIETHQCRGCNIKFKSLLNLERHAPNCSHKDKLQNIKVLEVVTPPPAKTKPQYRCHYCNKPFTYPKSLYNHFINFCSARKRRESSGNLTASDLQKEADIDKLVQQEEKELVNELQISADSKSNKRDLGSNNSKASKRKLNKRNSWTSIKKKRNRSPENHIGRDRVKKEGTDGGERRDDDDDDGSPNASLKREKDEVKLGEKVGLKGEAEVEEKSLSRAEPGICEGAICRVKTESSDACLQELLVKEDPLLPLKTVEDCCRNSDNKKVRVSNLVENLPHLISSDPKISTNNNNNSNNIVCKSETSHECQSGTYKNILESELYKQLTKQSPSSIVASSASGLHTNVKLEPKVTELVTSQHSEEPQPVDQFSKDLSKSDSHTDEADSTTTSRPGDVSSMSSEPFQGHCHQPSWVSGDAPEEVKPSPVETMPPVKMVNKESQLGVQVKLSENAKEEAQHSPSSTEIDLRPCDSCCSSSRSSNCDVSGDPYPAKEDQTVSVSHVIPETGPTDGAGVADTSYLLMPDGFLVGPSTERLHEETLTPSIGGGGSASTEIIGADTTNIVNIQADGAKIGGVPVLQLCTDGTSVVLWPVGAGDLPKGFRPIDSRTLNLTVPGFQSDILDGSRTVSSVSAGAYNTVVTGAVSFDLAPSVEVMNASASDEPQVHLIPAADQSCIENRSELIGGDTNQPTEEKEEESELVLLQESSGRDYTDDNSDGVSSSSGPQIVTGTTESALSETESLMKPNPALTPSTSEKQVMRSILNKPPLVTPSVTWATLQTSTMPGSIDALPLMTVTPESPSESDLPSSGVSDCNLEPQASLPTTANSSSSSNMCRNPALKKPPSDFNNVTSSTEEDCALNHNDHSEATILEAPLGPQIAKAENKSNLECLHVQSLEVAVVPTLDSTHLPALDSAVVPTLEQGTGVPTSVQSEDIPTLVQGALVPPASTTTEATDISKHQCAVVPNLDSHPGIVTLPLPSDAPTLESPPDVPTLESPPDVPTLESPPDVPTLESPPDVPTLESPPDVPTLESPPDVPTLESPPDVPTLESPPDVPTLESTDASTVQECGAATEESTVKAMVPSMEDMVVPTVVVPVLESAVVPTLEDAGMQTLQTKSHVATMRDVIVPGLEGPGVSTVNIGIEMAVTTVEGTPQGTGVTTAVEGTCCEPGVETTEGTYVPTLQATEVPTATVNTCVPTLQATQVPTTSTQSTCVPCVAPGSFITVAPTPPVPEGHVTDSSINRVTFVEVSAYPTGSEIIAVGAPFTITTNTTTGAATTTADVTSSKDAKSSGLHDLPNPTMTTSEALALLEDISEDDDVQAEVYDDDEDDDELACEQIDLSIHAVAETEGQEPVSAPFNLTTATTTTTVINEEESAEYCIVGDSSIVEETTQHSASVLSTEQHLPTVSVSAVNEPVRTLSEREVFEDGPQITYANNVTEERVNQEAVSEPLRVGICDLNMIYTSLPKFCETNVMLVPSSTVAVYDSSSTKDGTEVDSVSSVNEAFGSTTTGPSGGAENDVETGATVSPSADIGSELETLKIMAEDDGGVGGRPANEGEEQYVTREVETTRMTVDESTTAKSDPKCETLVASAHTKRNSEYEVSHSRTGTNSMLVEEMAKPVSSARNVEEAINSKVAIVAAVAAAKTRSMPEGISTVCRIPENEEIITAATSCIEDISDAEDVSSGVDTVYGIYTEGRGGERTLVNASESETVLELKSRAAGSCSCEESLVEADAESIENEAPGEAVESETVAENYGDGEETPPLASVPGVPEGVESDPNTKHVVQVTSDIWQHARCTTGNSSTATMEGDLSAEESSVSEPTMESIVKNETTSVEFGRNPTADGASVGDDGDSDIAAFENQSWLSGTSVSRCLAVAEDDGVIVTPCSVVTTCSVPGEIFVPVVAETCVAPSDVVIAALSDRSTDASESHLPGSAPLSDIALACNADSDAASATIETADMQTIDAVSGQEENPPAKNVHLAEATTTPAFGLNKDVTAAPLALQVARCSMSKTKTDVQCVVGTDVQQLEVSGTCTIPVKVPASILCSVANREGTTSTLPAAYGGAFAKEMHFVAPLPSGAAEKESTVVLDSALAGSALDAGLMQDTVSSVETTVISLVHANASGIVSDMSTMQQHCNASQSVEEPAVVGAPPAGSMHKSDAYGCTAATMSSLTVDSTSGIITTPLLQDGSGAEIITLPVMHVSAVQETPNSAPVFCNIAPGNDAIIGSMMHAPGNNNNGDDRAPEGETSVSLTTPRISASVVAPAMCCTNATTTNIDADVPPVVASDVSVTKPLPVIAHHGGLTGHLPAAATTVYEISPPPPPMLQSDLTPTPTSSPPLPPLPSSPPPPPPPMPSSSPPPSSHSPTSSPPPSTLHTMSTPPSPSMAFALSRDVFKMATTTTTIAIAGACNVTSEKSSCNDAKDPDETLSAEEKEEGVEEGVAPSSSSPFLPVHGSLHHPDDAFCRLRCSDADVREMPPPLSSLLPTCVTVGEETTSSLPTCGNLREKEEEKETAVVAACSSRFGCSSSCKVTMDTASVPVSTTPVAYRSAVLHQGLTTPTLQIPPPLPTRDSSGSRVVASPGETTTITLHQEAMTPTSTAPPLLPPTHCSSILPQETIPLPATACGEHIVSLAETTPQLTCRSAPPAAAVVPCNCMMSPVEATVALLQQENASTLPECGAASAFDLLTQSITTTNINNNSLISEQQVLTLAPFAIPATLGSSFSENTSSKTGPEILVSSEGCVSTTGHPNTTKEHLSVLSKCYNLPPTGQHKSEQYAATNTVSTDITSNNNDPDALLLKPKIVEQKSVKSVENFGKSLKKLSENSSLQFDISLSASLGSASVECWEGERCRLENTPTDIQNEAGKQQHQQASNSCGAPARQSSGQQGSGISPEHNVHMLRDDTEQDALLVLSKVAARVREASAVKAEENCRKTGADYSNLTALSFESEIELEVIPKAIMEGDILYEDFPAHFHSSVCPDSNATLETPPNCRKMMQYISDTPRTFKRVLNLPPTPPPRPCAPSPLLSLVQELKPLASTTQCLDVTSTECSQQVRVSNSNMEVRPAPVSSKPDQALGSSPSL